MAGKNTAVFGIFPTHSEVELAVDELRRSGFRNVDISVLLPQNVGSKDLAHQKATKAPEGVTAGATTVPCWEGPWGGWPESGPWRFRGLVLSSPPGPWWPLWRASVSAGRWAGSQERWLAWEFPSTRPNDTKGALRREESCCRSIVMTHSGYPAPRTF